MAKPKTRTAAIKQAKTIGFLHSGKKANHTTQFNVFKGSLQLAGYVEGQNLTVVDLWADNDPGALQQNARNLAGSAPDLIVAAGGSASVMAAKVETLNTATPIPVVFFRPRRAAGLR